MNIRLGRIPYLNSEVFYQDFPLDLVELHDLVPSALSRAARRGEVDVGPVPVVTCFELEEQFMPLGDFGISVKNKARSVLLLSKRPIEELDGARIGVTGVPVVFVNGIYFSGTLPYEELKALVQRELDGAPEMTTGGGESH